MNMGKKAFIATVTCLAAAVCTTAGAQSSTADPPGAIKEKVEPVFEIRDFLFDEQRDLPVAELTKAGPQHELNQHPQHHHRRHYHQQSLHLYTSSCNLVANPA